MVHCNMINRTVTTTNKSLIPACAIYCFYEHISNGLGNMNNGVFIAIVQAVVADANNSAFLSVSFLPLV